MNDENSAVGGERDLLGDPVGQRDELIGAPPFEITEHKQMLVATLRAAGWSQERIATNIGCDPKTLRKHFSRELAQAGDLLEAKALSAVADGLLKGNMSAVRKMLELIEKGRAAVPLPADDRPPADTGGAPDVVLGKKEQQKLGAENPPAGWGAILPPDFIN